MPRKRPTRTELISSPMTAAEQDEEKTQLTCSHLYWVIATANGPVSVGICQTCGETRDFQNYVEDTITGFGERKFSGNKKSGTKPENDAGFLAEELDEGYEES